MHPDIYARFAAKIYVNPKTGCHEWQAAKNYGGYGQFRYQGESRLAHRVAYEMAIGPIPDGLVLDHLCRVRNCVNPEHLEPKTQRANTLAPGSEAIAKDQAERVSCPRDHMLTRRNLVPSALRRGKRQCLACNRALTTAAYHRRRNHIHLDADALADAHYAEIMKEES